jgi:hypothetical protein
MKYKGLILSIKNEFQILKYLLIGQNYDYSHRFIRTLSLSQYSMRVFEGWDIAIVR